MNEREKSMLWWSWLTIQEKDASMDNGGHLILSGDTREPETLTGLEIEILFDHSLKCAESDEN
jgi:hypothetical protein